MRGAGVLLNLVLVSVLATPGVLATLTDGMQNDAGTGGDAGDSSRTATHVTAGTWSGRTFMFDDPQDWYAFTVQGSPDEPKVEVHVDFTISSPTCTGVDVPVTLQTVTVELIDPKGERRGLFTTTGCGARGHFDTIDSRNQTADNPGIGTWSLGFMIDGVGGTQPPKLPGAGGPLAARLPHAEPLREIEPGTPPQEPSPPNAEQDYAATLGCKPFC